MRPRLDIRRSTLGLVALFCVMTPLLIALVWGDIYEEASYQQFQAARALAQGEADAPNWLEGGLYTRLIAFEEHVLPLAWGLSVGGWSLAILAWFGVGLELGALGFASALALLLSTHPLQPRLWGTVIGLLLALWGLTALGVAQGRRRVALSAALLLTLLQPTTLALVLPLLLYSFWDRARDGLAPTHLAITGVSGVALYELMGALNADAALNALPRLALWLVAGQLLVAAGFAKLWPRRPGINKRALLGSIASLSLAALVLAQGYTLWQAWRLRPVEHLAAYQHIAGWMAEHTLPDESVGASRPALIAYLTHRHGLALADKSITRTESGLALLKEIVRQLPDYCLALDNLAWQGVCSQPWFQERYQPVYRHELAYDTSAPWTLYRYTPSPFDAGMTMSTTARFQLDHQEQIVLESYRFSAPRLTPGEPLYLTLNWRALTTLQSQTCERVRVVEAASGKIWARAESCGPESAYWPAGKGRATRHLLGIPENLPAGAYRVEVTRYTLAQGKERPAPVLKGNTGPHWQPSPLELAELQRPPNVSVQPLEPDHPLQFTFAHHITLLGYDVPHRVAPSAELRVALYWRPAETVPLDYKVFVHLLASDGALLSQSDGMPVAWTYPTSRWDPGEYVRDEHRLPIDPAAARGDYRLVAGLYDPQTGERANVWDAQGATLPARQVTLATIQVR